MRISKNLSSSWLLRIVQRQHNKRKESDRIACVLVRHSQQFQNLFRHVAKFNTMWVNKRRRRWRCWWYYRGGKKERARANLFHVFQYWLRIFSFLFVVGFPCVFFCRFILIERFITTHELRTDKINEIWNLKIAWQFIFLFILFSFCFTIVAVVEALSFSLISCLRIYVF